MYKNKFFLILIVICNSFFVFGQDINNSNKSIKIWRTTDNIDEVIAFPINSFSVTQNTIKYIYMMVNYNSQPDIAIAIDATDENLNGNFANIIRPIKPYTNYGKWETLVFPISGGENGINVSRLLIYPDIGIKNKPSGQILNNSGNFGYIDEITLNDTNTLSTELLETDKILIFPNPSYHFFKINTTKKINKILLYNNLGKEVTPKIKKTNTNTYDIRNLSEGLYFIKIIDETGSVEIKKMIKK